jgi:hypothetical protein
MNVSKAADAAFIEALRTEDPARNENLNKNMRLAGAVQSMSEDQALTNFLIGYPTGQWKFEIVAGLHASDNDSPNDPECQELPCLKVKRRREGYLTGDDAFRHHLLLWGAESAAKYWPERF